MNRKHKNLQPWLDYFAMLRTYEEKGFLQIEAEKHEAYMTEPALYTLAGCQFQSDGNDQHHIALNAMCIGRSVRHLRTYAAWLSASKVPEASASESPAYDTCPFAVNIVKDTEPHAPLHTIVLTTRRRWWNLWIRHDHFEVITY